MRIFFLVVGLFAVLLGGVREAKAARGDHLDFSVATQPAAAPSSKAAPIELSFDPPEAKPLETIKPTRKSRPANTLTRVPTPLVLSDRTDTLFAGGSKSLVARTVGHAEGTRTVEGGKTRAYYGHVDPGNGVWNLGSFSYQHCYSQCSPEEADDRQLQRLRNQTEVLKERAASYGLRLSLEAKLNGIDLANQAPLAALDRGGYIDRLNAAYQDGLTGSDAVLWARTYSFVNPRTQTWDAPGLGNTYDRISHDQERRRSAIARVLEADQRQQSQVASSNLR